MSRFIDYIPISRSGSPPLSTKRAKNLRSIRWLHAVIVGSVVLNLYTILRPYVTSPPQRVLAPLDNYQDLHRQPIVAKVDLSSPSNSQDYAIVTTLYTDAFASAVATLGHSIQRVNSTARKIVLYFEDRVSTEALCRATSTGFSPHAISRIPPPHNGEGVHPHFLDQFSKLNLWTLDILGIKSLVYLDADTLVRQNFDELFTLPYNFAAVPDVYLDERGFTLGFNAGVLFLRPSTPVFNIMSRRLSAATYPRGDAEQAFLNLFYGAQAVRLPAIYNGNLAIKERKPLLWEALLPEMKIVHYTLVKPFLQGDYEEMPWQELDNYVPKMKSSWGGSFKQEVGWWESEWRATLDENWNAFSKCSKGSAS